ncbi:MAG: hypothetical protein JWL64_1733, partial [Frankiales bacterium]|nr:hypothetical protein [Frankiales bacterium]
GDRPAYGKPAGGRPAPERHRPQSGDAGQSDSRTPRPSSNGRNDPPRRQGPPPRTSRPSASDPRGRAAQGGSERSGPAGGSWEDRPYDPRREERRQKIRVPLPDDVDPRDLDGEVRRDLRSLAKDTAELVAKHLIMTGRLIDEEPVQALAHARAAAALAGRVGAVREAAGLAAYAAEEWNEAIAELRTARRITGQPDHLAVLADSERALGRPERALALLNDPDVARLEQPARVELIIVGAGARRDLGEFDAAVLLLQGPAQATTAKRPWAIRLWYAYADALLAAGRADARDWFEKVVTLDEAGDTDAVDRLMELDGVVFEEMPEESDALSSSEHDQAESERGAPQAELDALVESADLGRPPPYALTETDDDEEVAAPDVDAATSPARREAARAAESLEFVAESVAPGARELEGESQPESVEPAARSSAPEPDARMLAAPLFSDEEEVVAAPVPVTPPAQQELFSGFGANEEESPSP